ncbi:hypothetical protein ABK040_005693 [Willaertia magna]
MTDFSLNDFLDFSSSRSYFSMKYYEEDNETLLSDAEEKIKQQLMIILYKLIIYSDCLFTIKKGKEDLYEMIFSYVFEREMVQDYILGVKKRFRINKHLELFDDLQNIMWQQKKRKVTLKKYTLTNYFETLCLKYFGDFGDEIYQEIEEGLERTITCYEDRMRNSEERKNIEDLLFIGYVIILEYFTKLILQNEMPKSVWIETISTHLLELVVNHEAIELVDNVRNMIYFPEIDLNYLYGSNLNEIPLINNIIDYNDKNTFCIIPNELHSIILRYFDSFSELLRMRLVCKNWNYFILKDQDIWKYLTYHSLIKERIFTMIDSSFTLQEMEQILQNSLHYCNDNISTQIRLVKHYFTNNDWFNIYYLLIKSNLNLLKVLLKEIQKYFGNNINDNVLNNLFRIGVYNNFIDYRLYDLNYNKYGEIEIFEKPEVSENNLEQFNIIMANEKDLVFIGQINCKEFSSFLSARYLPKYGVIYFFIEKKRLENVRYRDGLCSCAKVFYLNRDNEETEVIPKKEGLLFHYNEKLQYPKFVSGLIEITTEQKTTFCGACSDFDLYNFRFRKIYFSLEEDEIMLFARRMILWNEDNYVIFTIKRNDLKNRLFDKTQVRIINFVDYNPWEDFDDCDDSDYDDLE